MVFVEGARRQKLRARRNADDFSVRGDRARHGGAVLMRFVIAAERIEIFHDHAVQIWIFDVDLGIDQRDGDIFAGGDAMGLLDVQFAEHVLLGLALAG
jgi:hypothetical protein